MLADRFYSNLSSDSDSDIDQNLDKLKDLFTRKKTLNKHLTATSPRYSTFESHYKSLGRLQTEHQSSVEDFRLDMCLTPYRITEN